MLKIASCNASKHFEMIEIASNGASKCLKCRTLLNVVQNADKLVQELHLGDQKESSQTCALSNSHVFMRWNAYTIPYTITITDSV